MLKWKSLFKTPKASPRISLFWERVPSGVFLKAPGDTFLQIGYLRGQNASSCLPLTQAWSQAGHGPAKKWPRPDQKWPFLKKNPSKKDQKNDQKIFWKNQKIWPKFGPPLLSQPRSEVHFWPLFDLFAKKGQKLVTWGGRFEVLKPPQVTQDQIEPGPDPKIFENRPIFENQKSPIFIFTKNDKKC